MCVSYGNMSCFSHFQTTVWQGKKNIWTGGHLGLLFLFVCIFPTAKNFVSSHSLWSLLRAVDFVLGFFWHHYQMVDHDLFNVLKSLFFLDSWMSHLRPVRAPSNCPLCPFDVTSLVSVCLFTLAQDVPGSSTITLPQTGISHFPKECCFLLSKKVFNGGRTNPFIYALYIGVWVSIHLKIKQNFAIKWFKR